jgi:hypothetical protein
VTGTTGIGRRCATAAAALAVFAATPAVAQLQDTGIFVVTSDTAMPPAILQNARIDAIRITGVTPGSPQAEAVATAFAVRTGDPLEWLKLQRGLTAVRALEGVGNAVFTVERQANPTTTTVTLTITEAAAAPQPVRLPTLIRTDRALVTLIANGAFGAFTDGNPWFADGATFTNLSPIATNPALGRASFAEASFEAGVGGITQLGSAPVYLYGAATAMWTASVGQDLFTAEARSMVAVEKLYAGILIAEKGSSRSANLSVGRQNYSLNEGFLISQYSGSANAGPRPGLYLNPRTTFDMTGLVNIRLGNVRVQGFYLDPNELEDLESNTTFAGANINWQPTPRITLGATWITIPRSDTRFRLPGGRSVPRQGEQTASFNLRLDDPLKLSGVWLQGDYAWQWNGDETRAWAGYATIGWRGADVPWQPSLSYRYSAFSGDDPATPTYERYDPLLSGGLAEWVQGINMKKLFGNTNMNVQRVRGTVKPAQKLTLTFDFFDFEARELNNIGGSPALATLATPNVGQEFTLRGDWAVSRRIFVLLIASLATPGSAITEATARDAQQWTSLQASLFLNF